MRDSRDSVIPFISTPLPAKHLIPSSLRIFAFFSLCSINFMQDNKKFTSLEKSILSLILGFQIQKLQTITKDL
ncbi:hypothetical protein M0811_14610 [Anaeramoeba ignava]|uniref:Uncharacterized protein n=1 Tax=Anaeramoeba ignava TaxID=1746090 RepID=A0A9Q0RGG4_ANAIG|nr:hypothetical protein M0811_14610 [Anaeramoeba ignava]